jgi:GNAT superfamily N-acetyltransferase
MIVVSSATPDDAVAIADLMQEMDLFYGEQAHETSTAKVDSINSALFTGKPSASALLAWKDSLLVGFASYSILWPAAMSAKSLYLKELYIRQAHRSAGIGSLLMSRLSELALESGCNRLEWTTDEDNEDAQEFYHRLGVSPHPSKLFYRAEGDTLRAIAADPWAHRAAT